uniref:Uncharacterized protein n=2 Tax=Cacopsylla melanoneura TaxID=428564 RepID=A0A8D8THG8_9HEMI
MYMYSYLPTSFLNLMDQMLLAADSSGRVSGMDSFVPYSLWKTREQANQSENEVEDNIPQARELLRMFYPNALIQYEQQTVKGMLLLKGVYYVVEGVDVDSVGEQIAGAANMGLY